jgi:guanine deaminase
MGLIYLENKMILFDAKEIKEKLINLRDNNHAGYPFSACIIYNGEVYYDVNKVTTSNDPTAHAEIEVIRQVCAKNRTAFLKRAILITSGEPCPMCISAIAWAEIKDIYYIDSYKIANSKNYYYDQSADNLNKFLKFGLKIKQLT